MFGIWGITKLMVNVQEISFLKPCMYYVGRLDFNKSYLYYLFICQNLRRVKEIRWLWKVSFYAWKKNAKKNWVKISCLFKLGMQKVTVFIYRLTDPIYW